MNSKNSTNPNEFIRSRCNEEGGNQSNKPLNEIFNAFQRTENAHLSGMNQDGIQCLALRMYPNYILHVDVQHMN